MSPNCSRGSHEPVFHSDPLTSYLWTEIQHSAPHELLLLRVLEQMCDVCKIRRLHPGGAGWILTSSALILECQTHHNRKIPSCKVTQTKLSVSYSCHPPFYVVISNNKWCLYSLCPLFMRRLWMDGGEKKRIIISKKFVIMINKQPKSVFFFKKPLLSFEIWKVT